MSTVEFDGVTYNDDRMFILYICKCTIEEDANSISTIIHYQEVPVNYIWSVATFRYSGRPARSIVTRLMRELGPLSDRAPAFPLATAAIAALRTAAEARGSGDFSPLWAGQNASGCREIPAAEVVRELAEGWDKNPAAR